MTKNELQEYRWLKKNIDQLEDNLLVLESKAMRVSPVMSDMPSGRMNSDKLGDIIGNIVDTQNLISERLRELYLLRDKIETDINKLPGREQCLVRLRYIEGKSWEQIAVEMCYGWAQIHRIHSDSLILLKHDTK